MYDNFLEDINLDEDIDKAEPPAPESSGDMAAEPSGDGDQPPGGDFDMNGVDIDDGEDDKPVNLEELLPILDETYTPVLIMQSCEDNQEDKIRESISESSVMLESGVLKFDNSTRMAQLLSVCSLLIARQRNSKDYQEFIDASHRRREAKARIREKEEDNAKSLAQRYLLKMANKSPNADVRRIANELLPEST